MARELTIDVEVNALRAEVALGELEADLRKVGHSVEEADKKAKAFDRTLKEGEAKRKYKDELDAIRGGADRAAESQAKLTAAIMRYAGPAVILEAARRTIAWAENIQDMAERTGLSTTYVQQLTKVAEKNGTTFATMANLIQQSEQRLASGNKRTVEVIREMGLSVEDLLAMNPEERFRALARALADIEDPAKRSEAEMALFGRAADGAAVALNQVAEGADKVESALGPGFIQAGAQAQNMLEDITHWAHEAVRAFLLWPAALGNAVGEFGKNSLVGTAFGMMGFHGAQTSPALPGAPGATFMPSPLPVPGDPFGAGGVGGNSMGQIIRSLRLVKEKAVKPAPWEYIPPDVSPMGGQWWTQGNRGVGFFPGWAIPDPLVNSMTRSRLGIGFDRESVMAPFPSASMVSPASLGAGSGGNWFSNLFKGRGGQIAGLGMGLLSNLIPGLSRTGSSIGGTLGSIFGPLGSGIGSLAGGLFGKLFGGGDGKALRSLRSGEDFQQLIAAANAAGVSVDKLFSAKKVKDFEKAVKDVNAQITSAEQETQKVESAMERWGLSIEDMGKKFQQTQMDKAAKGLVEDFVTLVDAGASVEKVIEKMGTAINDFILKAIQMGIEVPRSMKPIVDKMREQGLLVDENGQAFSDQMYESIQWATTLTQGFDKVEAAINRLADAILGVKDGFESAEKAASDFNREVGSGDYGQPGQSSGETPGFASGGVAGRDWRRPGVGDVIPALLKRGERVLPAGVSGGGVTLSVSGDVVVSGSFGGRREFAEKVGEAFVAYFERRGKRLVA